MKRAVLFFVLFLVSLFCFKAFGQDAFVTTWQTTTANESVTIPTTGSGYDYTVDWGDGTVDANVTGDATHVYSSAGVHTISITGEFPRIFFNRNGDREKIQSVQQWGDLTWTSMANAFEGCLNLDVLATDIPDLSSVSDMSSMFESCISLQGNDSFGNWNVASVTNMSSLFFDTPFNQDIGSWNMQNVTTIFQMFFQARSFNQDIGSWNVASVTNMSRAFEFALSFDQNLGAWNIQSLTTAENMFLNVGLSQENYDATLIGWATLNPGETQIPSNITFDGGNSQYCNSETQRQNLIDNFNWTITDGGKNCLVSNSFITTWQTTTANESITIPTTGSGYNYTIDWGDGTVDTGQTGNVSHSYAAAGIHTISITGDFPRIFFNNAGDKEKILTVEQWGTNSWVDMERAFFGCSNLDVVAQDVPDLTNVSSFFFVFAQCENLLGNPNFNDWDTSSVTNMSRTFEGCAQFNQPIGNWNMSAVTNTALMFGSCTVFNQPIGNWDMSAALDTQSMFNRAGSFNQDITNWDLGSVTTTTSMFLRATSFNQPIGSWDVSNVVRMDNMFTFAESFNQPIGNWNVSSVTTMQGMFTGAITFNQPLNGWDVSSVTEMTRMFDRASTFNQPLNDWDVSSVVRTNNMFESATAFDQPLSNWDTSGVTQMLNMFFGASSFDQNLADWDISSVTTMRDMFDGIELSQSNYDATLIGWGTLNTAVGETQIPANIEFDGGNSEFCDSETQRQDLIDNFNWTIADGGKNCPIDPTAFITTWETTTDNESITIPTATPFETYDYTVDWGDGTSEIGFTGDATHTYVLAGTYSVSITGDFPSIQFAGNGDVTKILTVEQWGATPWKRLNDAFNGCINLDVTATDTPDLSQIATTNSNGLARMFLDCTSLVGNSSFNNWDLSLVPDIFGMFNGATLFNQDIGNWDVSSVTRTLGMFFNATSFNQDIGRWDVGNVTDMNQMFFNATSFNQDLSDWDVSSVQNMTQLFDGASSFDQNLGNWDIGNTTSMSLMLRNAAVSNENYDSTLIGWATLEAGESQIPSDINFNGGNSQFCAGEPERQELIDNFNWTIIDGGKANDCADFSNAFITSWETTTVNESITIPTFLGETYDYSIDWGDGTIENNLIGDATHTYNSTGTHIVSISGTFPRIFFNDGGDNLKIKTIEQWGNLQWSSMEDAFSGCFFIDMLATDIPNLSQVSSLKRMFSGARNLIGNNSFNSWNVSTVTNMEGMFFYTTNFNQPLGNWDVGDVTNMYQMFYRALAFNQPIGDWDVSNVTDMGYLLAGRVGSGGLERHTFNQPLENWDVGKVVNMTNMLAYTDFNHPIDNWNVSNVTDMSSMFEGAHNFDQSLANWNVGSVTNFNSMFGDSFSFGMQFDQNLGSWDVSSATTLQGMFQNHGLSFENYDSTLIGWATLDAGETQIPTNVIFSGGNSQYCDSETQRQDLIDNFNWTVTDGGLNCPERPFITTWETVVANQEITIPVFDGETYDYTVDWGDGTIDTNVTGDAVHTYSTSGIHTVSISGTFPRIFFSFTGNLNRFGEPIRTVEQWGDNIWSSMSGAFFRCIKLNITATDVPDLSNVTDISRMFFGCTALTGTESMNTWDTGTVTNMTGVFEEASNFNQDIGNWNVENVVSFSGMFHKALVFNQSLSSWNTSSAQQMALMFKEATAFNQPLNSWNTQQVASMEQMFMDAISFNQPVGSWNTQSLVSTRSMFNGATAFNQPINDWNTPLLRNMDAMFMDATAFDQSLDNWNVSLVNDMTSVFENASAFNRPLGNWNVSNVRTMHRMFRNATAFDQNLGSWDVGSLVPDFVVPPEIDPGAPDEGSASDMFSGNAGLSTANYDALLLGWGTLDTAAGETQVPFNITITAGNSQFCDGESIRQELIDNSAWRIQDNGKDPNCTIDDEAPVITCPDTISVVIPETETTGIANLVDPSANDNISDVANINFAGTRSDGLPLTDPYSLGDTTISWTATDEAGNASISCDQTITVVLAETETVLEPDGTLDVKDCGAPTDDEFTLASDGINLIFTNTSPIIISGDGVVQQDANTVLIPLSGITNGLTIDGGEGNNTLVLDSSLQLLGPDNGLTLNNVNVQLSGSETVLLNELNIAEGTFDLNGVNVDVSTNINVFDGGIIAGNGSISGTINFGLGAFLAPGASPGRLEFNDLVLDSGSTYDAEVNGPAPETEHDIAVVTGTVTINGASLNLLGGYANAVGDEIILIDNDGTDAINGTFDGLEEGAEVTFGNFRGTVSYVGGDGNDVSLVGTNSPPQIVTLFPEIGATEVPLDTELVMTFDRDMVQGSQSPFYFGNLNAAGEGFESIRVEGNQVFLTPRDLDPNSLTTIVLGNDDFRDLSGTSFTGLSGGDAWTFTTITSPDNVFPVGVFDPPNGSTDILENQVFSIQFDEEMVSNVLPGEGVIDLYLDDGTYFNTIFEPNFSLTFDGQNSILSFTIPNSIVLSPSTTYRIEIFEGRFEDIAGNDWRQTADTSNGYDFGANWRFTTSATLDLPTEATFSPLNGSNLLPVDQTFTITFNEFVQIPDENALISLFEPLTNGGARTIQSYSVASGEVVLTDDGSVSILTIDPSENLPPNTFLTLQIADGYLQDLAGNNWGGTGDFGLAYQFATGLGDAPCTSGDVDLEITFDNFAGETSWELVDQNSNVIDSASYSASDSNTTITDSFTNLTDGIYTFTIRDSFGDGICCQQGFGSYKVTKNDNVIFEGGIFLTEQSFQFCIDASIDAELPVITCPSDVSQDAGTSCSTVVTLVDPTATDNVSNNFVFEGVRSDGLPLTDPFFVGTTTITWTAEDEAGNISEACTQNITITGSGDCWFDIGPEIVGSPSNTQLGSGVAINATGNRVAYIAPNANGSGTVGTVTILENNNGTWQQLGNAVAGGQGGRSFSGLDLNDTGDRLAASQSDGNVQVYELNNGNWSPLGSLIPSQGQAFIQKLDFDSTGNLLAVGYAGANDQIGSVGVYQLLNGEWQQLGQTLTGDNPGDNFGRDVNLNVNGTRLAVGAYQLGTASVSSAPGYARTLEWDGTNWEPYGGDIVCDQPSEFFGVSIGLNDNGTRIVVGDNAADLTKVFELQGDTWQQLGNTILPINSDFHQPGYQVDINGEGNIILVGDFFQPTRVFEWNGAQWQLLGQPIFMEAGQDVSMNRSGGIIVLGGPEANNQIGKVAILEYTGNLDSEAPTITCPDNIEVVIGENVNSATITLEDPTATDNLSTTFTFNGVRSDALPLTDPYPIGVTTITWTATDQADNVSAPCDQTISIFEAESEAEVVDGDLSVKDCTNDTDDTYDIAIEDGFLILSNNAPIIVNGEGVEQRDANTVAIPLSGLTTVTINGGNGTDALTLPAGLDLNALGIDLITDNIDVVLDGNGTLDLANLSVNNGDFTTNVDVTVNVSIEANFFADATLSGNGTINGVVNMNVDSNLFPGTSPGMVNTGNLTLDNNDNEFEVNGTTPGTEHDQIVVTGTVTIVSGTTLNLLGSYTSGEGDQIVLIDNDGTDAISGAFDGLAEGDEVAFGDFTGTITYQGGDGNDLVLIGMEGFILGAFVTTWQTTTANESITIPTTGSGYNYTVDWGDGTDPTNETSNATHTYVASGTYTVSITGDFPRIYFNFSGDRNKILTIEQWGDVEWASMERAFFGCENLDMKADDVPVLSAVTSLAFMFADCKNLVGNTSFNEWNTNGISDLGVVFAGALNFNQPLDNWDVGQVTNMGGLFSRTSFNQNINQWDVGNVTNMGDMFNNALSFDQPIDNWDTSSVTSMSGMFLRATSFNQDIGRLDVGNVEFMGQMFDQAGLSVENYDSTLIGWSTLDLGETRIPENITFYGGNSQYCLSETARQNLIDNFGWTITDGGKNCPEPTLLITEIMYNPANSDNAWEYIELYNNTEADIDLSGYVIDDNTGAAYTEANITAGIIPAGQSAIVFDGSVRTAEQFAQGWGDINPIAATRWSTLNNTGDTIGIWDSFESYEGDHETQANVIEQVVYENNSNGWPDDDGSASIYLTDLDADNTVGSNWALSVVGQQTPLFDTYTFNPFGNNQGLDVGSPGIPNDTTPPTAICQDVELTLDASGNATLTAEQVDNISSDGQGSVTLGLISYVEQSFDQNVIPEAIFGTGNTNGSFTINQEGDVELGLRAKVRYPTPENTFNSNGDGTYSHLEGTGNPVSRALWNFEWSVNTDPTGSTDLKLDDLTYEMGIDFDPTTGTDYFTFDMVNTEFADHSIGDNSTDNGGGTEAVDATDYTALIANNNVAQNSWNLDFFNELASKAFDPSLDATYEIYMKAFDGTGKKVAETTITVIVGDGGISGTLPTILNYTTADIGNNQVTLVVTDEAGNTSTCLANIIVGENIPPTAICQEVTLLLDENGLATLTPEQVDNGSNDASGIAGLSLSRTNFDCNDIGDPITVTLTVTDGNGNTATCSADVTVVDETAPELICGADIVDTTLSGQPLTFEIVPPTITDNCGGVPNVSGLVTFPDTSTLAIQNVTAEYDFPVGTTSIRWSATDASGNQNICTQTVTVNYFPSTGSSITSFTAAGVVGGINGTQITVEVPFGTNLANLAPELTISEFASVDPANQEPVDFSNGPVTYMVTAQDGSTTEYNVSVSIESDTINPSISCPSAISVNNDPGQCGAVVSFSTVANDDRPGVAISYSQDPGTVFPIGITTVTATATDAAGNSVSCDFDITVTDIETPTTVCADITVQLDANGEYQLTSADFENATNATDNCGISSYNITGNSLLTCADIGTTEVTITVTDDNGLQSQCTINLIVEDPLLTCDDVTAPTISCPSDISVNNDPGQCGAVVSFTTVANDDRPGVAISYSQDPGTVFPVGITTVTATATDAAGNAVSCDFDVAVTDNELPIAVCQDISVQLDGNGSANITALQVDGGSTDNCGVSTLSVSPSNFTNADLGENQVTLTVRDVNGNTGTCTATVTVEDVQSGICGTLPSPWTNIDIGVVGAAGSACYVPSTGTFEVEASGADIWNSGDEFHYVYQELTGDGEIVAQVLSLDNTNQWAKAGVMMRNTLAGDSEFAMMSVSPNPNNVGVGYTFQDREFPGQFLTAGPNNIGPVPIGGFPYYVRLVRQGNTFTGYASDSNGSWQLLGSDTIVMGQTILVGLATTSHNDGIIARATYDNVEVTPLDPGADTVAPVITVLGDNPLVVQLGGTFTDPGATANDNVDGDLTANIIVGGDTVDTNAVDSYTITYNVSDAAGNPATEVVRTVNVVDDVNTACGPLPLEWTNSDIGDVGAAGSACYVPSTGTFEVEASGVDIWSASDEFHYVYQELTGDGEIIAQVLSLDNTNNWAKAGVMMRNSSAPDSEFAMMSVSPNPNNVGVGYTFQDREFPGQFLTAGPNNIGPVPIGGFPYFLRLVRQGNTFTGYASDTNGNWQLLGSDTITMGQTILVGLATTSHNDGVIANASFDNVSVAPLDPGADTVAPTITVLGDDPLTVQFGDTFTDPGATANDNVDGDITANIIIGGDTVDTNTVDSYIITYNVSDAAGNPAVEATRTVNVVDDVNTACGPLPSEWTNSDIGDVGAAGSACYVPSTGTFEVEASGVDIWSASDEFHYVYQELTGDGEIIAQVLSLDDTNNWAKAGVMMRNSGAPDSQWALMSLSPNPRGQGVSYTLQNRPAPGASPTLADNLGPISVGDYPYYVRLVREGNEFLGYASETNGNWQLLGSYTVPMDETILVGLALTSHNDGVITSAQFNDVSVIPTTGGEDSVPPTITVLGDDPLTAQLGDTFVDPGATANDNVDGDITANIIIGGDTVDTNTVDSYIITYNVSDAAGNPAVEATRTVNVVDNSNAFSLRINAGGPEVVYEGHTFQEDTQFNGGYAYTATGTDIEEPFVSERSSGASGFGYNIPLANGEYDITLYFAEIYFGVVVPGSSGDRIFDVIVENNTVLDDYDIIADVGAGAGIAKTFRVTVLDGELNLNLESAGGDGVNQPKLSAFAIEGVSNSTVNQSAPPIFNNMRLSPNPATISVKMSFDLPTEVIEFQVFDIQGRLVRRINVDSYNGTYEIPVFDLPVGTYFIKTMDKNGKLYDEQMVIER